MPALVYSISRLAGGPAIVAIIKRTRSQTSSCEYSGVESFQVASGYERLAELFEPRFWTLLNTQLNNSTITLPNSLALVRGFHRRLRGGATGIS